ncbi:MAG: hypothetical protein IJP77_08925 [Bacteroidales bacterium]|nr:hypothetical protein [Bacteroidales bacterium]
MRKTYHICLSSHDEVMFRSEADLCRGFNALALAILETDSRLLAEGILTTHFHELVQTDCPEEVIRRTRYSHARFFNTKYKRRGSLGERRPFVLEVDGFHHTLAALNYVNRQGLHHGLSQTPFGYRHCSASVFFQQDLGHRHPLALMPADQRYKYLPKGTHITMGYRMDTSGLLLREDIIDTAQVESFYVSPRNYLFQMNKIGDALSAKEQQQEESSTPIITMAVMEPSYSSEQIGHLLQNEKGRHDPQFITDLELCTVIDEACLPKYFKGATIYELTPSQRTWLFELLWKNLWGRLRKRTTAAQLKRCLCL